MSKKATRQLLVWAARDGYRWRLFSSGRIVAESGEAYTRNSDAVKAARNVFGQGYPILMEFNRNGETVREQLR